jgi:hypothetical protein
VPLSRCDPLAAVEIENSKRKRLGLKEKDYCKLHIGFRPLWGPLFFCCVDLTRLPSTWLGWWWYCFRLFLAKVTVGCIVGVHRHFLHLATHDNNIATHGRSTTCALLGRRTSGLASQGAWQDRKLLPRRGLTSSSVEPQYVPWWVVFEQWVCWLPYLLFTKPSRLLTCRCDIALLLPCTGQSVAFVYPEDNCRLAHRHVRYGALQCLETRQ